MSPDCSRYESPVDTLVLAGVEALVSDGCGDVGVEVDHSGESTIVENWDDAIRRFNENDP